MGTQADTTVPVDEDGFPRSLPFDSDTDTVTRVIAIPARRVLRDDVLIRDGGLPDAPVLFTNDLSETALERVVLRCRIPGEVFGLSYEPEHPVTVRRTKHYGAKMPNQRSLTDQLGDLLGYAEGREGLDDAVTFLGQIVGLENPGRPTDQDTLNQLRGLVRPATRKGMYDAADFLKRVISPT